MRPIVILTDVTQTDEDTNSILTDKVNRTIHGNVAMQVAPSGDKIWNYCNRCHLVTKFVTNASGAIWWPNLQLMQVAPSGGQF